MNPHPADRLVKMTFKNSTVDGQEWSEEAFASLGFASTNLSADSSYACGCLKYLPSLLDSDFTCGHRVRSKFKRAKPVNVGNIWMWEVIEP